MTIALRSGNPPRPEDCQHEGRVSPPKAITNETGSGFEGNMNLFDIYGSSIPDWSRVRYVLRITRNKPKPYSIDIPDMGTLYVGDEGWELKS